MNDKFEKFGKTCDGQNRKTRNFLAEMEKTTSNSRPADDPPPRNSI
jgi:hypothetical protein